MTTRGNNSHGAWITQAPRSYARIAQTYGRNFAHRVCVGPVIESTAPPVSRLMADERRLVRNATAEMIRRAKSVYNRRGRQLSKLLKAGTISENRFWLLDAQAFALCELRQRVARASMRATLAALTDPDTQ